MVLLTEIENIMLKFIRNHKIPKITNAVLSKKNSTGRIATHFGYMNSRNGAVTDL